MELKRRNKVTADFNMSSMTDLVFLLLIFFMLTSNFVTPSGLPVNLPTTKKSDNIQAAEVSVTITNDMKFLVGPKQVTLENLEAELKSALSKVSDNKFVVLHVDKAVPTEYFVKVASIANSLGAKVSLATKTEQ
ncbi:biopolymer transporter ExbD [uncultured Cytophaga sp.]|uniref:ExbD/TolR family protein n=1 Tax=uncultured Cytophaga sp. TaxID=160238 RepID=UPI00263A15CD|nr:biopolymer transporter ExbD [uncultured Cytophaga sp.]